MGFIHSNRWAPEVLAKRIGKKQTQETIDKRVNSIINNTDRKRKVVYQYTRDGDFIKEWSSASEVSRILSINTDCISACCRGTKKTYKDYEWSYEKLEDIENLNII